MDSQNIYLAKIRRWKLFNLIAALMTVFLLAAILDTNLDSTEGLLAMIRYTVRSALPCFLLAFTASSLHRLYPSVFTRWLVTNRKYLGLAFAYGMAWQVLFIAWLILAQKDYFFDQFLSWFQYFEGVVYLFLIAMTFTSFSVFSRYFSRKWWRVLHKTGMYLLWFIITATYLMYSAIRPSVFVYLMAVLFVSAYLVRILAWRRNSRKAPQVTA